MAVASSFIAQLALLDFIPFDVTLVISSQVNKNLTSLGADFRKFSEFYVEDVYGFQLPFNKLPVIVSCYDAVFTIFGPTYFIINHDCHVMGLANPYLVYQKNPISSNFNLFYSVLHNIKCSLQIFCFSRAAALLVELPNIKTELELNPNTKLPPIYVVSSAVDEVYFKTKKWMTVPKGYEFEVNALKFGVIAKNYPHKNLKIFPFVRSILKEKYGIESEFYVALDPDEWASTSDFFKDSVRNIGPLSLDQCPDFYNHLDAVVFPTLLECFSAVLLETMLMKKPLFSSNFSFIRDVCGSHCNYFDPFSAKDIAEKIFHFYSLPAKKQLSLLESAHNHALTYPDARSRANSYLGVIQDVLMKKERVEEL